MWKMDYGGTIIEKALAFDKGHQPFWRAHGAEGSDDGYGVGGGDQCAEDEGGRQRQHAGDNQNGCDDAGAEQDARHGHGHDRRQVGFQILELQVERGFKDERRDEETENKTRRQLQMHPAAEGQDQPGADQRHGVRQSYAAHGQGHEQYDCQHLDDFKFQLKEGFHDLLQCSRGAAWFLQPAVKLLVRRIYSRGRRPPGNVRHTVRDSEIFDNLTVLHASDGGKGELLPVFQYYVGKAQQVGSVEAEGKAVADEGQSLTRMAGCPVVDPFAEPAERSCSRFPTGDRFAGAAEDLGNAGGIIVGPLGRAVQLIEAAVLLHRQVSSLQKRRNCQAGFRFAAQQQPVDFAPERLPGERCGLLATKIIQLPESSVGVRDLSRASVGDEIKFQWPADFGRSQGCS